VGRLYYLTGAPVCVTLLLISMSKHWLLWGCAAGALLGLSAIVIALPVAGPVLPGARPSAPPEPLVVLPLTVTPPFMTLYPQTLFASPGEPAAPDALAGGLSELQLRELPSAAIVGSLNPAQPLPAELSDCRWAQSEGEQLACHVQVFLPPGYFESERR